MKGLILKDFYMAIKYCRFYLVITVIFAIASIYGDSAFFLFYPVPRHSFPCCPGAFFIVSQF